MTFINRNGMLYVSINGTRKSTKLKYSKQNIKKFQSYYEDEEFFNNFNIKKDVPTLLQMCDLVLLEKETTIKVNSYRAYDILYNSRIKPYFKNMIVSDITPAVIYDFYKTFKDKSTLTTVTAILKFAFEKAIIKGYISSSPLIISKPKLKSNYKINPFTYDEANIIINSAPSDTLKNLIGVAFYTGMRTGEILALKWENLNFENYTITVNCQMSFGYQNSTKTNSSNRIIDMISKTEYYLKEQFKITRSYEFVFLKSDNKPYHNSSSLYYIWKTLINSLNFDYRSFYQTRHTFASNMLSNGENALWVSQMLGHKSLDITLSKYSKYLKKDTTKRKITYLDNS
ncbi:MAG: tyrosine-type recombinase/integrase [Aliarcobacter sp.]|jgi:integrase|nr:tyrosine-type recombinase/integrase [Aliarcobacter sp.]